MPGPEHRLLELISGRRIEIVQVVLAGHFFGDNGGVIQPVGCKCHLRALRQIRIERLALFANLLWHRLWHEGV